MLKVVGRLLLGGIVLAVVLAVMANVRFDRLIEARFGTANPMTYVEARVDVGMGADEVGRTIAPDLVRYHRMQDGAVAQELVFELDWAPDFRCFVIYRGSSVSDIEYEQRYLGEAEPLSEEEAERELGL